MYTLNDIKKKYIDFLMSMNLEKMDMSALSSYGYIIKNLDDMEKPGYAESLALAFGNVTSKKLAEEAKENA